MRADDNDEHSTDMQAVDEGIQSPMFWAYIAMLRKVGGALTSIMNWAEQCPCHESDPDLQGADRHKVDGLRRRLSMSQCPLAGRRAPEAAAGALREFVVQLLRATNADVLVDPRTLRCSEEAPQGSLNITIYPRIRVYRHVFGMLGMHSNMHKYFCVYPGIRA